MNFTKEPSWKSSMFPTYRVQIPTGGEATLAVTAKDHVSFDANHHCINGQPGDRCWIVCRGVQYGAHIHFYLKSDGWHNGDHNFVTRVENSKNASLSAEKWIVRTILEIVEQFYAQHPEVFAQAENERIDRALESKRTELAEARKQLAEITAAIEALENELAAQ